jgi:prepilin peptidase CpaA
MSAQIFLLTIVPALFVFAAVWDIASFTIPNFIILALLSLFILFVGGAMIGGAGIGWPEAWFHLLAGTIGLVIGMVLFGTGVIGGGDAKLFAVAALWIGLNSLFEYTLIVTLFGGLLTLFILVLRSMPMPLVLTKYEWVTHLLNRNSGIPYGVALAAGALFMLPRGELFRLVVLG